MAAWRGNALEDIDVEQRARITRTTLPLPWIMGGSALLLGVLVTLVFLPQATLLAGLRWLDSGICAQLATHSFFPGGQQLPLCARNTGIYLGFMATLVTLYTTGRGRAQRLPPWPIFVLLICGIVFLAIDGFNSFLLDLGQPHLYQPQNLLRLASGLITGLAMGTLILPILNRLLWCAYDDQCTVPSWQTLLLLFLPILIICFFAVASQSALVLYPIALLSTLGLVTALSSVNLIIVTAISRREQSFATYRELLPFFSIAFVCAIVELLALAQGKFLLLKALGL